MRMNIKAYNQYASTFVKPSPIFKNYCFAFLTGGAICVLGEFLLQLYAILGFSKEICDTLNCISLIFLSVLCTALHLYEKLAKLAGAGTLVPITGFANAVSSAAIEFQSEGMVLGVGAKLFSIAGPVIAYGTIASVFAGIFYYIASFL